MIKFIPAEVLNIYKKIEDKIAYNRIENTFGGWTLGGLIRKSEDDEMEKRRKNFNRYKDFLAELNGISISEYSFNPAAWAKAYGDLNSKLYATAKAGNYKFVRKQTFFQNDSFFFFYKKKSAFQP